MKRVFFFGILFLVLFSIVAVAAPSPHPLLGEITQGGYPVSNVELKIKDLNTKAELTTVTDVQGRYQLDMSALDQNYRDGDTVTVTLVYCANLPVCSGSARIEGGFTRISFDLDQVQQQVSEPLPLLPDTVTVVKYVCWDGTGVESEAQCPVAVGCWDGTTVYSKEQCPAEPIKCADGTIVSDANDCPESSNDWIKWVIGILVALLLGGGGWKIYNGKFKHWHRGIIGYHDPSTKHTNAKYRHTPWNENPLKCIMDTRKIQQGIDLSV